MDLSNKSLEERKKLTKSYPVLISSFPKTGKTSSLETLSPEDKARTIFIDVESKGLPDDDEANYKTVVKLIGDRTNAYLYKDEGNIKYKDLQQLMSYTRKAMAHEDVDRIVIDSFTALVSAFEQHYVTMDKNFTVWTNYTKELNTWFKMIKEETYTHGKFLYVFGHYVPAKPIKDLATGKLIADNTAEKFTKVKGTEHYRMVESHFNTVVTIEDYKFIANNANEWDSTRVRRSINPIETKQNCLAELEELLTK